MNAERIVDPCRKAELAINRILRTLEADTGRLVVGVSLRHVNVTNLNSMGKELLSGCQIELQKMPEHRTWEDLP